MNKPYARSHPFGKRLEHFRLRKPGFTQAKLAERVGYDPSVITKMCQGRSALTGPTGRSRVLRILGVLREIGVLSRLEEANALLEAANMPPLFERLPAEAELIAQLRATTPNDRLSLHSRGNLPVQLTSFVGREDQIASLVAQIRQSHLLTSTGVGGVGKTRLAQEVAAAVQDGFVDGVWWVELAALTEPALLAQTVAQALRLPEQPERTQVEALLSYFETRQLLLILDNCEHLIEASAELAHTLLRACPLLRILVTSREALNISGEMLWSVPPLAVDQASQLFVERAQAMRPGFTRDAQNASVLTQVCTRLDGLPLAIELAAARMNTLSLEQIASRLDDRFNLLSNGKRTAIPRHQTLRAALTWSFDLLSPIEQTLMACLSVFRGGFTAEAVQAVFNHPDTGELIASLVDKSLIVAELKAEAMRYRLLETIRQYCLERLSTSRDKAQIHDRHLAFFLDMAEETIDSSGPDVLAWKRRMSFEEDNLRAAFAWSSTRDDQGEAALRLAGAMFPYRNPHGRHVEEGLMWVNTALARGAGASASARARALLAKTFFCTVQFDFDLAARSGEESLSLFRQAQDPVGLARCLEYLAIHMNDARTLAWANEALHLFRELGSLDGEAAALESLAVSYLRTGKRALAAQHYEQAIAIARWRIVFCIGPLYTVHPKRALALCAEEVALWKEAGDESADAEMLSEYGLILVAERNYELAQTMMREYIQWEDLNSEVRRPAYWNALMGLALTELSLGHADRAITYLEQAQQIAHTMSWMGYVGIAKFFIASTRLAAGNLTHATRDLHECLHLFQKLDFRAGIVCSLIQTADLERQQGRLQRALQLLGVARKFGGEVNAPPYWINFIPALWHRDSQATIVEPTLAAARQQFGAAEVDAIFDAVQGMTLDQAIVFALEDPN